MALSLALATATTFAVSILAVVYVVLLGKAGYISRLMARKIMHIGTGPAFILCCCLFPESPFAPILASSAILFLMAVFSLVGVGLITAPPLVAVVSRSGDPKELLVGPLLYGAAHVAAATLFWLKSPIGPASVMILCAGDGVADIVGRRLGASNPLPWSKTKSWAGSCAFWAGAYLGTVGLAEILFWLGSLDEGFRADLGPKTAFVVTVAAFVESVTAGSVDNLTIFAASVISGKLVW